MRERSLVFCYLLSEPQINGIKRLLGVKQLKMKSVKSIHPCQSVIQTSYDIVKAHGGEIKAITKEGDGTTFIILLIA
jgi:hypothetical protein